ncbi:MAG: M14 family metallopeptidase [Nitrospinaceae bacterium]
METHTVVTIKSPLGSTLEIIKQTFPAFLDPPVKRISFVAGLHGDELEGVYLCHRLIEHLRHLQETEPRSFTGEIHIYPAVNPQAVNTASRLWPFDQIDMNRQMGQAAGDSLPAESSRALLRDLQASSDLVVDVHASNLHLMELPQIRIIEEFDRKLIPLAARCNVDLIWVHPTAPVFETTLGYNLNRAKIPTLVVETGTSLRIQQQFSDQVFQGMLHLLSHTGILGPPESSPGGKQPLIVNPDQVTLIRASHSGLFISRRNLGETVRKGEDLGRVIDPVRGATLEEIGIPADGLLFTLREHPVTYQGAPLARIARGNTHLP